MADSPDGAALTHPLAALKRVSAGLGRDPLLIQGAGGNTSLKCDDVLWVKASGCWLEDAEDRPVFVPIRASTVLDNIARQAADCCAGARVSDPATNHLRPSIETALHAIMRHPTVVHAHAVNSSVTALLDDGHARFEQAMGNDLRGLYLPYATPGLPLAKAVHEAATGDAAPDIILLQNHGLVVGAESPDAAAHLLREVERRLALPLRPLPEPDPKQLSAYEDAQYEALPPFSGVALDPYLFDLFTSCVFTPDQAVFLGGPVHRDCATERSSARPALILRQGIGAFQRRDASAGTKAVISWLVEIAKRFPERAEVHSLSDREVANLLGWDAEQYRMALDRNRGPRA
jgi:rhamnose utilization protein RhaD (predicted bifunctional aldolase and dehydrogenase)